MLDLPPAAGAALFLASTGLASYAVAIGGVAREAVRPERKTVGWALGRGLPVEPSCWGTPSREWSLEFEGSRCPIVELGDPAPDAPTALVLHGFGRSRYDSLARAGVLLPHVRRVLLPDLPGHGDAEGRSTRLGTGEERFALAVLAAARCEGPVILMGHSLGATIAIHAAALPELADRVRGVVALAPYESLRTPLGARLDLRGMPRRALLAPTLALLKALGIHERSTREASARLRCPLAVLAGDADPVTPLAEARAIADAAPRSRFTVIERGRHDDFLTLGRAGLDEGLAWIGREATVAG